MKLNKNKNRGFGLGSIIGLSALVGIVFIGIAFVGMLVSAQKTDVDLRTRASALQTDNRNEFDNMWKKISQVVQVSERQKNSLKEVFTAYAQARSGNNPEAQTQSNHALMNWVQEAVPNYDQSVFNNVMNTITGARDRFTFRQTSLIDVKREHDKFRQQFPNNFILPLIGRSDEIKITIVTSERTEDAFQTGKDNNVDLSKQ